VLGRACCCSVAVNASCVDGRSSCRSAAASMMAAAVLLLVLLLLSSASGDTSCHKQT
jgi:hypothetical protein